MRARLSECGFMVVTSVLLLSCNQPPSSDSAQVRGAVTVKTRSDLEPCTPARVGVVYYVQAEGSLYYCDGSVHQLLAVGTQVSSVQTRPATAAECASGGVVVLAGVDGNGDGMLTGAEVASQNPVCNGKDGRNGTNGSGPGASGTITAAWTVPRDRAVHLAATPTKRDPSRVLE